MSDETKTYHPSIAGVLQFFTYEHLKEPLRSVSERFHALAHMIADELPANPELTVGLRKLLEAKDCAVRSLLYR